MKKISLSKTIKVFQITAIILLSISLITLFIIFAKQSISENNALVFTREEPIEGYALKKFASITGQVVNPGVYVISEGMRVSNLIDLAGGLTTEADSVFVSEQLNFSKKVEDEEHIYIPTQSEAVAGASTSGKISLNSASKTELESLPGVGESTAQKIIDARPFNSIEDLLNVEGIGDSKFNQIKDLVEP